ncbi:hypothetical protein TELCIR_02120 [Teladorsagia circumcincta]|uniref:Uncharacterized protein n=1 Tax=Teladorsagia circumcincta TaxID=45464 RepID=A0A2G9V1H2_TELCI|nr:hypothetical protein TELCIR_02120 [Teladorsagia circumcincta]
MRKQFEFCVTREFVPALDDEIVRFRFYPVCDEEERNIPMLYIAVISIDDKVEEVYQLSSGRFYYANGKNVMQTSSISEVGFSFASIFSIVCVNFEVVKRITRHETRPLAIRQRPGAVLRHVPYLGDPIEPDDSLVMWFFSRAVLYGFPAFLTTLLSCKFVSKLFPH